MRHNFDKASLHLWFLSLLFLFYIAFLIVFKCFETRFRRKTPSKSFSFKGLVLFGFVGAVCFFLINLWNPDYGKWLNFEYFWTYQPTRLPLYGLYFSLGIAAYHNKWFSQKSPLSCIWLKLAFIFTIANLAFVTTKFPNICDHWYLEATHAFLHSFSCLSLCLVCLMYFKKHLNTPLHLLSTNSYAIYIIHFNVFLWIEWKLVSSSIPTILKFLISGIGAYLFCLAVSELILKRIPYLNTLLFGAGKKRLSG